MWNHASVRRVLGVWDILSTVSDFDGLPDDCDIDELLHGPTGPILDCGQKVLDDDNIWASLPEVIEPPTEAIAATRHVLEQAEHVSGADLPEDERERVLQDVASGRESRAMRKFLRELLDECR